MDEEFVFFSVIGIFSRRKLGKIADYFEFTVPRHHCDGLRSYVMITSSTFELLTNLLAPSEHIGRPSIEQRRQRAVTVRARRTRRLALRYLMAHFSRSAQGREN